MRNLLKAVPILIFAAILVFKVIKTPSLKGFFNLGKFKSLSFYEGMDFVMMVILAYSAMKFSFQSEFNGLWYEWLQIVVSLAVLYRFYYIGFFRMIFKQESLLEDFRLHSFFKGRS